MSTNTLPLDHMVRGRDPETSWAAAESIGCEAWTAVQHAVYNILYDLGPLTHPQLVAEYKKRGLPRVTDQRIRSACHTLVVGGSEDFGRVRSFPPSVRRADGTRKSPFGRSCQMWEVIR